MGRRRTMLVIALAALAVAVAAVSAVLHRTRQVDDATGAVRATCSSRLLADWSDGAIHGSYPLHCYRRALRTMPADLAMYSSAPDDISQALSRRIAEEAGA